jgi:hypothetical protein
MRIRRARWPMGPRLPPAALAAALGLAFLTSGCVELDGELAANGSLVFRYTYDPPTHATVKSETARLSSPHVRVENLERDKSIAGYPPGELVTATLAVDDARQLSSAPAFAAVQVGLDLPEGQLQLTFPGLPAPARENLRTATEGMDLQAFRLALLLPGPVTHADPTATIDGRRVTWILSRRQFVAFGDTVTLAVSWAPGATS